MTIEAQRKDERYTINQVKADNYLLNLVDNTIGSRSGTRGSARSGSSELSRRIAVPQQTINYYISMLNAPESVQEAIGSDVVYTINQVKAMERGHLAILLDATTGGEGGTRRQGASELARRIGVSNIERDENGRIIPSDSRQLSDRAVSTTRPQRAIDIVRAPEENRERVAEFVIRKRFERRNSFTVTIP